MPIRINLLAEEQAAEEMRRKDPIKRAMYLGAILIVAMFVWIGLTQMNVNAARSELSANEARLKDLEESSKTVRANQFAMVDIDTKLKALEKYSTNRFFWGSLLNSIQHAMVGNIRLTEISGAHSYRAGDVNKFFITNITSSFAASAPWWKFWAGPAAPDSLATVLSNALPALTNSGPFLTNILEYKYTTAPMSTNATRKEIVNRLEFASVPWAQEEIGIVIRGRDYGNPPGAAIDEFSNQLRTAGFLKDWVRPGGIRVERPPQPRSDPQDLKNPDALFIPFTIELRLKERIFTNE